MKKLIQYQYACTKAMYDYLQGNIEKPQLIGSLKNCEIHRRNELKSLSADKNIWFRFFDNDTFATTINDIEKDLSLPESHQNHSYLIENMKITTENGSLEVYYS